MALKLFDFCFQPRNNPAAGNIDTAGGKAQLSSDFCDGSSLESGFQKGLPGRLAEFLLDLLDRPCQNLLLVFVIEQV